MREQVDPIEQEERRARAAREWHSVGLLKSMCPSCMLAGLALLPIELVLRGVRRLYQAVRL